MNHSVEYILLFILRESTLSKLSKVLSSIGYCGSSLQGENWDALWFARRCFENNVEALECRTIDRVNSSDMEFMKQHLNIIKKLSSCFNTLEKHAHFIQQ